MILWTSADSHQVGLLHLHVFKPQISVNYNRHTTELRRTYPLINLKRRNGTERYFTLQLIQVRTCFVG